MSNSREAPDWRSSLGVVAILLGVFLAAWHGNEWMKFLIVADPPYTLETMPEPDCEEDELEEEGLSLAECRQLAYGVQHINISSPNWFKGFHVWMSVVGIALALVSIFAGIALVDKRPWAVWMAIWVFGGLTTLDVLSFIGVVNTGPLIRQMYLWNILLWFFIHVVMVIGAVAGREASAKDAE